MILEFLVLVEFLTHQSVDFHQSAPVRIIRNQSPSQNIYPQQPRNPYWDGHFSAQKFDNDVNDRVELLKIKKNLRTTLLSIPYEHAQKLEDLEVRNQAHKSRGMANSKKIILHTKSIDNDDELVSVFVHELGHIVDLGVLKGFDGTPTGFKDGRYNVLTDDPSWYFYRLSWTDTDTLKQGMNKNDFVSGYAMSNCFEDFAESYIFYRLHGEKFRSKAKDSIILQRKYNFMKRFVFEGEAFQTEKETPLQTENIFDATLLAIDEF